jgi:hypothetical protein
MIIRKIVQEEAVFKGECAGSAKAGAVLLFGRPVKSRESGEPGRKSQLTPGPSLSERGE